MPPLFLAAQLGVEPPDVPVLPIEPPEVMPPLAVPDEPLGELPMVELELLPSVDVEPPIVLPLIEPLVPLVPVVLLPDERPARREPERLLRLPVEVLDWPLMLPVPMEPPLIDPLLPIVPLIVPSVEEPDVLPLPVLPVDWPPMLPPLVEPEPAEPLVVWATAIAGIQSAAAAIIIGIRIFSSPADDAQTVRHRSPFHRSAPATTRYVVPSPVVPPVWARWIII